jgi:hypothetical protein
MNAPAAEVKRRFIASSVAGQENGSRGFSPVSARNAPEQERVFALSAAAQALFKPRHNQTDPLSAGCLVTAPRFVAAFPKDEMFRQPIDCILSSGRANLLGLDVGRPDYFCPLLDLLNDELAKLSG